MLGEAVDLRYDWATPRGSAIEERRLKPSHPVITPSWPTSCWPETLQRSEAAHRTPPGSSALRESEASAANVLSVRKRSVSNKAPNRNGNQPLALPKSDKYDTLISVTFNVSYQKVRSIYIFHSKYLKSRCSMNIQGNFSNTSQW